MHSKQDYKLYSNHILKTQLKKMKQIVTITLLFVVGLSSFFAQVSDVNNPENGYTLKEVVILSRHNVRAPLSGKNSVLGKVTSHQWTDWTANSSELTLKGGVLETMMGQYFRKWVESENLFTEGKCPNSDEINIYANSMQRTIATAGYFKAGFIPTCDRSVYHRFSPSKMDPVFFPRLTKVSDKFRRKVIRELGGERGIAAAIGEKLKESYELIENIIDIKNSVACNELDICSLSENNNQLMFILGQEPALTGSLKIATGISDALVLQYFEEKDRMKASFGHYLTRKDWENISKVKDVYGDLLFSSPTVAVNVAHPLLEYIREELKSDVRKFTYLNGHDSNIVSVVSALKFKPYSLPNTIEKKAPIGGKLVFEKWQDNKTKEMYVRINMIYQTTDQLRNLESLSMKNPPAVYTMELSGLESTNWGFYPIDDVMERFNEAILEYENID